MTARGYVGYWLSRRDARYVAKRAAALAGRYDVSGKKARRRAIHCTQLLQRYGARPTFAVPGRVALRDPAFFRSLAKEGAELAVHGFDHVDFRGLTTEQRNGQLERGADAFRRAGLDFSGFRCPYMSWEASMQPALRKGVFAYSSNTTVEWRDVSEAERQGSLFKSLAGFYQPQPASAIVSTPRWCGELLEIPAAVPDDLQLHDGLRLGEQGLADAWLAMFEQSYVRGELLAPLFHPESFDRFIPAFDALLSEAVGRQPKVWMAPLGDIADWWIAKAQFSVRQVSDPAGLRIELDCADRATVLVRGLPSVPGHGGWSGYQITDARSLVVPPVPRPFVGLLAGVSASTTVYLRDQGYIVEQGPTAGDCSITLDQETAEELGDSPALVEHLDRGAGPLVRYWRWPSGYRSALAFAGDLDALSLVDYAARLIRRP
jgi:hypothetical protein